MCVGQTSSRLNGHAAACKQQESKSSDMYVADLLVVADDRIGSLQKEVDTLTMERDNTQKKLESLKRQASSNKCSFVLHRFEFNFNISDYIFCHTSL